MNRYFFLSLFLHLFLLLIFSIKYYFLNTTNYINNNIKIVTAQLIQSQRSDVTKNEQLLQNSHKKITKTISNHLPLVLSPRGETSGFQNNINLATTPAKSKKPGSGRLASRRRGDNTGRAVTNKDQISKLALLLHDLIQAQIQYPAGINIFGNRDIVASFVLFPDGHIEDTKLLKSSEVAILDNEVLQVIASLPKIVIAKELLQTSEKFNIPIKIIGK